MNDKRKFFYNGILLTFVGISMRTVVLLFNSFISRAIGAEAVGLHTVVMTVYGFAVTFATSGISLTVTRLVASAKGEGKEEMLGGILRGAILYALIFSLGASFVLYFGADFISLRFLDEERAVSALKILSFSLVPLSLVSVFSGYFVGIRQVFSNAITQVSGQFFKIGITVFLVLRCSDMSPEGAAVYLSLGTTMTEILGFFVIFIQFLLSRRERTGEKRALIRSISQMAIPLAVSAYIRSALLTLEHILIPKRLRKFGESPSKALSSYGTLHGMALPLILYPMVTLSSFCGLLVPEFAERSAAGRVDSMRRIASRAFGLTLVYAAATSVVFIVFSEELGYVIYNSSDAGKYIGILAPVIPIMYLDHLTDSVLKGIGEHVYSMWVNISDSLLSVFLVWFFVPRLGIIGYAAAIIIMEAYNFLLSLARLIKRVKFSINIFHSAVYPALAAGVSAYLTKSAFMSLGAGISAFLLICEIVFCVCMFVGVYKIMMLGEEFLKQKINQ